MICVVLIRVTDYVCIAIELNLRLSSMVRGKKGFQRVIYAVETVLTERLAWLFLNLQSSSDTGA